VHGLRERVELHVLAPPPDLETDMVDARPEHEAEGAEARLPDQEELVHAQVRGEQCSRLAGPHLGQAPHRIFGDTQLVGFDRHRLLPCGFDSGRILRLLVGVAPSAWKRTMASPVSLDSATWSVWFSPTSCAWMLSCMVLVIAPWAPMAATRRASWV